MNFISVILLAGMLAYGQSSEMTTHDTPATFTARSNLVLVHVVVRDKAGQAIGTLQKDDFQLLDKGKLQFVSKFSVEKSGVKKAPTAPKESLEEKAPGAPAPPIEPDRFLAYLFDDIHLAFGDLAQAREAAGRHLAESLAANSRAAIYTTSGQTMLDFTDDLDKLKDTLLHIQPRTRMVRGSSECPDLSYYQADLIQNKNDAMALKDAADETMACANMTKEMASAAASLAQAAASRVASIGSMETRTALGVLKDVVRRIAAMPGQRNVVVVSPGFLVANDDRPEQIDIMDRAIRSNVTVSALDARGLFVVMPGGDASQSRPRSVMKSQYETLSAMTQEDVLAEIADSTGGVFFHNSNDLDAGFKRVAAAPEYYYVLGFSPQNLKFDGSYHNLKVTLKNSKDLTLLARRGYFAPKHELDAAQEAKREIEEALFSRDELRDLPVSLHTQFFKSTEVNAKLAVLAQVDLKHIRFRKAEGRNQNTLTIVYGLFDRNGNFVGAVTKTVEMKLKDETLEVRLAASGITVKSSFDVTSGSYFIRLVVRDTEGQMMAALNGAVEIP